jgi:hypothetical protein
VGLDHKDIHVVVVNQLRKDLDLGAQKETHGPVEKLRSRGGSGLHGCPSVQILERVVDVCKAVSKGDILVTLNFEQVIVI